MTLWKSGNTNRWHNHDNHALRNSQDTNWAHQARVAVLIWQIAPHLANTNMLIAALLHDAPEKETGGNPGPAKWGTLKDVLNQRHDRYMDQHGIPMPPSVDAEKALSMADKLDAYLWARHIDPRIVDCDEWQSQLSRAALDAANLGVSEKFWEVVTCATN